jgi:hypothetical protein
MPYSLLEILTWIIQSYESDLVAFYLALILNSLQTMVEERHQFQQQLVHLQHQNPSKRHKTIYLVQKSKCTNSPKEARTVRRMRGLTQP